MRRQHHHGNVSCSFCGKGQREIRKLIAGPTVNICNECVSLCNDILGEETAAELVRLRAQLTVKDDESRAEVERIRAELKRLESERTEVERVLWLAQHPDAQTVAIIAAHFAKACDEAQDVPRSIAERARSLFEEIDAIVSARSR